MGLINFLRRHSSTSSSSPSTRSSHSHSHSSASSHTSTYESLPSSHHDHKNFERSQGNMSPTIVAAVQEPSKSEKVGERTTGFPEPLSNDRNTTLPHPEADTSPNATIIAPDVSPRSLSHTRSRSFLSRKSSYKSHRTNKSQEIKNGTVTTLPMPVNGEKGLYEGIVYADEDGSGSGQGKGKSSGEESRGSDEGRREEHEDEQRKRGVLRKLRH